MRVIVHVGLNKTGSTSLQHYLDHSRVALEEIGVIYPELGTLKNHWPLAGELLQREERRRAGPPTYLAALVEKRGVVGALDTIAELLRTLRGSDRILLLSHENFSVIERAKALLSFLLSVCPDLSIDVLGYCRDPIRLYPPNLLHQIRQGVQPAGPSEWRHPHILRARGLLQVFGDRLTLRGFDRRVLVDGDVIADFRMWFEALTGRVPPLPDHRFAANRSLSAEACALILDRQQQGMPSRESMAILVKQLTRFDPTYQSSTAISLPPLIANALAARNHLEWNRLIEDFELDPPQRALLRIEEPKETPRFVGWRAVQRWIAGYRSADYDAALEAFTKSRRRRAP